jgi:UDP-N-acetyl-D-galactosamine dehydrogenase
MGKVSGRRIAVIGLGYVGLPVAVAFAAKGFRVTGFDIDRARVLALRQGEDRTREVGTAALALPGLSFSDEEAALAAADFFIVTVPTPIDAARRPDLSRVRSASGIVGRALKPGDIVVYESTLYPGATEEECRPILEAASGLRAGADFGLGFSPERINPGDPAHRFQTISKVVAALDPATLDIIAETYGAVVEAGIHRAPSIRVAEAAKLVENTQRDLNIALMNELSIIFERLGIDTGDVLAAAATKWNFLPFRPGLVGGHCIGVDPYYLTHKAEQLGLHPQVVLAGRRANDEAGLRVARECLRRLLRLGRPAPLVSVLGLSFKENVPDIRNTRVVDILGELAAHGVATQVADPQADPAEAARLYGIDLVPLEALAPADAVVLAVAHRRLVEGGWPLVRRLLRPSGGVVLDVPRALDRGARPEGIELWRM